MFLDWQLNPIKNQEQNLKNQISSPIHYLNRGSVHMSDAVKRFMLSSFSLESHKAKTYLKEKSVKADSRGTARF